MTDAGPARIDPAAMVLHNSRRLRKADSSVAADSGISQVGFDRVSMVVSPGLMSPKHSLANEYSQSINRQDHRLSILFTKLSFDYL